VPGPAPDPNALRRDRPSDVAGWTSLPAEGYAGDLPEWPLSTSGELGDVEQDLWAEVWRKPQGAMWVRLGLRRQVAAYVRAFVESTDGEGGPSLMTAVLRMEDGLGISVKGMNVLRWKIVSDEIGTRRVAPSKPKTSARDRLKALSAGAA
jgi:hypothetical protein